MQFNLNELLVALSYALDFMEIDILGVVSDHSKRVAYMAVKMADLLGFSREELFDLLSLAILHDNGIGAALQRQGKNAGAEIAPGGTTRTHLESAAIHCITGEENIASYPLMSGATDVIRYHHENWDGSGFFGISGKSIPPMSGLIRLSDAVEMNFPLGNLGYEGKQEVRAWLDGHSGTLFSPDFVEAFRGASSWPSFWLDLGYGNVRPALRKCLPEFSRDIPDDRLRCATRVFSRIIDSKSRFTRIHSQELAGKAVTMARYYGKGEDEVTRLAIAADLHDVGKLGVSTAILDKPGGLTAGEMDVMQRHTYYTRMSLEGIRGFEDITEWAANHHEKLDGSGYPYRKKAAELDFNSRLMACLDIYQALTEERPYRKSLPHRRAIDILGDMGARGLVERAIVGDIDSVFGPGTGR